MDELSTKVQVGWGWFPSSWLLSPPLEMKSEGKVHALGRFYLSVWIEALRGGDVTPFQPKDHIECSRAHMELRYPLHGTLDAGRAQTVPQAPGLMGGACWAWGHRPWGFLLLHERWEQDGSRWVLGAVAEGGPGGFRKTEKERERGQKKKNPPR